ncbi:MAG: type II secretion system protein [Vulcanimicrobiota bacterium]
MKRRGRVRGFTIIEILIAIMVITIAIFGTIAAIAYGLRASELGRTNTLAIGVNRKIEELILGGNYQLPNTYFTSGGFLTSSDLVLPFGSAPWKKVFYTGAYVDNFWFKLADYGYLDPNAYEAKKFVTEADNYELHVHIAPLSTVTTQVDSRLNRITITTRWRDKTGWKNISTTAYNN